MKTRSLMVLFLFAPSLGCGAVAPSDAPDGSPPDSGADAQPAGDASIDATAAPLAAMEFPRSVFGAATGKDGRVRAFGGLSTVGLAKSAEAYDEATNAWSQGAFATVPRYGHTVTEDASGHVYVLGGTSDGANPIASVEVYDPASDSWSAAPDMPTARLGLAAATAKDGRIFAIGGGVPGSPMSVVEIYSPDTKAWSAGPSMPTARLSLQAVTGPDGLIYAIGGRDANTTPLAVVEVLDPVKGTWTSGPPMSSARYWFGATLAHDGRIVVAGGIGDTGFLDGVEALTVGVGWSKLAPLPETRAWLATAVTPAGHVLAIGGSHPSGPGQPAPLATMFAYDPAANAWSQ